MSGWRLRKILMIDKSAKDVVDMPLKASYKSNSTRHLYEIADEIAPTAAGSITPKNTDRRQKS